MATIGTGKDAKNFGDTPWGRRQATAYASALAARVVVEETPAPTSKKKASKKKRGK